MKKILLIFFLLTSQLTSWSQSNDYGQFTRQIDQAWTNRNYDQIINLINTRLEERPNDFLALSLKPFYYIFTDGYNLALARQSVDIYMQAANNTSNEMVITMASSIRRFFYEDLEGVDTNQPSTQNDRDLTHNNSPDSFPWSYILRGYAIRFDQILNQDE